MEVERTLCSQICPSCKYNTIAKFDSKSDISICSVEESICILYLFENKKVVTALDGHEMIKFTLPEKCPYTLEFFLLQEKDSSNG